MTKAIPGAIPAGRETRPANQGFASFGPAADERDARLVDAQGNPDFAAIQQSEEFQVLRRRLLRFVFPLSVAFFAWYLTYVMLSAYAHEFMSRKVTGQINVGVVLGLLQFVSTIIITLSYSRYAKRRIDPQVDLIRRRAGLSTGVGEVGEE
jgi:uncharacterized membrane protein (DUF485 family)